MKVRGAAALTAAVMVSGALLAACSSGPTPQGVADSYLAAWAQRDWPAMRALVAKPPADFAARERGRAHRPRREAGQLSARSPHRHWQHGARAGDRADPSSPDRHRRHQDHAAAHQGFRDLAGPWSPATIAPQLTQARRASVAAGDLAAARADPGRRRDAADDAGGDGHGRRRRRADQEGVRRARRAADGWRHHDRPSTPR